MGSDLKDQIRSLTNVSWNGFEFQGDREFCRLLETVARLQFGGQIQPVLDACAHIHKNVLLSGSIDQFLSSHQAERVVVICAKLAIATQIARAERECHLNDTINRPSHSDFVYLKDTWLPRLWSRLQNGEPIGEWNKFFDNFRVITFNYDRCIEQFLSLALNRFCKVEIGEATEAIEKLPIVHVYGSLGQLRQSGQGFCQFAPDHNFIIDAAKRILTFSETVKDNVAQEIDEYCRWCERIVFLGFSYANVNMNLFPESANQKVVLGSSYMMSKPNSEYAKNTLNYKFCRGNDRTQFADATCARLFDDFDLLLN